MLMCATVIPTATMMCSTGQPMLDNCQVTDSVPIWMQGQNLHASNPSEGATFGHTIAISGDTAVIGAHAADTQGMDSGTAYIFVRDGTTWTQQAEISPMDGSSFDYYGWSAAISGDTVLVGAEGDNSQTGSAYIFTRQGTTWTQQAKLTPSDGAAEDTFGYAVALQGNTAVIGSPCHDDAGSNSGSVYIFTAIGSTWIQTQKITASDADLEDYFGISVSISNDTILIGADGALNLQGAAYVYVKIGSTWTQQAKLTTTEGIGTSDSLGFAVSLDGNTALLGAPYRNETGVDSGVAYIFTRTGTTWTQDAKLVASDEQTWDFFGTALALNGSTAIVTSPFSDQQGSSAGAAYVFTQAENNTWPETQIILASDGSDMDWFGGALDIKGTTALIGAYGNDDTSDDSGSVYTFTEQIPPTASFTWTPAQPIPNHPVTFNASSSYDPDGTITQYAWDWNQDGVYDETHPTPTATTQWTTGGTYNITLKVTDNQNNTATLTQNITIDHQPSTPSLDGQTKGKYGKPYTYTATTTDPDMDTISYCFNWSDGTPDTWVGPIHSGALATANHTWTTRGTYTIKVMAQDTLGATSNWTTLPVKMPYTPPRPLLDLLTRILERHPHAFPLLQHLLG
jgi:hypothetical protein